MRSEPKLIRRHPHVFGDEDDRMKTAEEVIDRWESIKAREKRKRVCPKTHPRCSRICLRVYRLCFLLMTSTRESGRLG